MKTKDVENAVFLIENALKITGTRYERVSNSLPNTEDIRGYKEKFRIRLDSEHPDLDAKIFIKKDYFSQDYEILFITANLRHLRDLGCSVIIDKYVDKALNIDESSEEYLYLEARYIKDMKRYLGKNEIIGKNNSNSEIERRLSEFLGVMNRNGIEVKSDQTGLRDDVKDFIKLHIIDGKDIWFCGTLDEPDESLNRRVINFVSFNEALAYTSDKAVLYGNFIGSEEFLKMYGYFICANNIEV